MVDNDRPTLRNSALQLRLREAFGTERTLDEGI